MLLGSPPDMIRGYPLRETGPAAHGGGQVRGIYFTTILPRWQLFFAACFAFAFMIPSVDSPPCEAAEPVLRNGCPRIMSGGEPSSIKRDHPCAARAPALWLHGEDYLFS